jgi:hypothetical protein
MSNNETNADKKAIFSCNQKDIIEAEKEHLQLTGQPVTGLAISGGGIRSASFGLGVIQALVANNVLSKIDYLSTVSGGGYIGAALTWALKQGSKDAGTSPENFPLGKKNTKSDNTGSQGQSSYGEKNRLLDYIRQHASYLTPTSKLDIVSFAAVVIRAMSISLFVYFSFLSIAITFSLWLIYHINDAFYFFSNTYSFIVGHQIAEKHRDKGVLLVVGLYILGFIFLKGFLYSLGTYFRNNKASQKRYLLFIKGQQSIGLLLKLGFTCIVFGSLPYVIGLIGTTAKAYNLASGSTIYGILVGLWQYTKAKKNDNSSGPVSDIVIYSGVIALFYGVLLLAYLSTGFFLNLHTPTHDFRHFNYYLVFIFLSILFGLFVNLNLVGPHNLWRSRLMETFLPNKEAVNKNTWMPATEADDAHMEDMCDENNPRPYHIINTNIILANSPAVDRRSRGGDNYILSPLYCGSSATGWRFTKDLHKQNKRGITLASAMATSAAALNPNAGVSGAGVTRNYVVSILLAFLNLRLGFWTKNPDPKKADFFMPPNFFFPGLSGEIFRTGLSENNRYIQLSDGGHFENLGVYELIRRKLDLIIVSDGGADLPFNFDDLANAIEKVRVDFGVSIKFLDGYNLDNILPGTVRHDNAITGFESKYEIAQKGFAIADIIYPGKPDKPGKLVYLKLAMIDEMPTDIYSYKGVNPTFPHETTADQFFTEKQFEAYRELGYSIGWQMFMSKLGKEIFELS